MKLWIACVLLFSSGVCFSQGFQLVGKAEFISGGIGETLKIPLRIQNTSGETQFYIIRKLQGDLSSSQKGYFCLGDNCLTPNISQDQTSKKVEPGETVSDLIYAFETGMVAGDQNFVFEIFPRSKPQNRIEYTISLSINEDTKKNLVFQSKEITIHDVYPNPVTDIAYIDYLVNNPNLESKLIIHNILGRSMGEYELSPFETRMKISTEELVTGVYFYTIYLDNEGVVTRKLIVRK